MKIIFNIMLFSIGFGFGYLRDLNKSPKFILPDSSIQSIYIQNDSINIVLNPLIIIQK